jgi:hypothetical protein
LVIDELYHKNERGMRKKEYQGASWIMDFLIDEPA